jgi:hypothetical protein
LKTGRQVDEWAIDPPPGLVDFSQRGAASECMGTHPACADLFTEYSHSPLDNVLKINSHKPEETMLSPAHFHLTETMVRVHDRFSSRVHGTIAAQGGNGVLSVDPGRNRKRAPRGARDNQTSGKASFL